ncbi:MAG TPA: hypothetical protein VGM90_38155 [Kofleriaceae bacterium]
MTQTRAEVFDIPQPFEIPLDMLVVVDNSAEIAPYKGAIEQALTTAGDYLAKDGGWSNMHLGVVTADVDCDGTDGVTWRTDPAMTSSRFLIDWRHPNGTRSSNIGSGENVGSVLARMASPAATGCGVSRPFDAVGRALADQQFRRDGADLIVVMLTAVDETSAMSPTDFADLLRGAPGVNGRLFVSMAGPGTVETQERFAQVWQAFPQRALVTTIDGSLDDAAMLGVRRGPGWWGDGDMCSQEPLLDQDPAADGVQPSCAFRDVLLSPTTSEVIYEHTLPACNGTNAPCWRVKEVDDKQVCDGHSHGLVMHFDRLELPPAGTHTVGECEAEVVDGDL